MKDFISSNGHVVHQYGRFWFRVSSASRAGLYHFVDLEKTEDQKQVICPCEDKKFRGGFCRHIWACAELIAEQLETGDVVIDFPQGEVASTNEVKMQEPPKKRQYTLNPSRRMAA